MPNISPSEILSIVENKLQQVHTHAVDISFNELLDMHKSGELIINPDYQRLPRWSEGARSRFIESLILGMPVPPIFVIEEESNVFQLIDGLQRITSYLHLRGELIAPHLKPPVALGEKLVLSDCDIIKELNGLTYDDLGTSLQIRLKRRFVRMEVVGKSSDIRFKYHMFKRLNTGGENLTNQQLRNCTIRMLDAKFNEFIIDLSRNQDFIKCVGILTQEQTLGAYDQELIPRYFALKNDRSSFNHDVADFLTDYMEKVSDPEYPLEFDYENEKINFEKTFKIFSSTLADASFGYPNKTKTEVVKGFSIYHFEALTMGIQEFLVSIDTENQDKLLELAIELKSIKLNEEFVAITQGGGRNSKNALRDRIAFVSNRLQIFFNNGN